METISAIIRGDLPPVGSPITLGPRQLCTLELPGFHTAWVNSGTSALALALMTVKNLKPGIYRPEVIIPAYGCPDLVAACVYAGCVAKLVDIRNNAWGYDISQLEQALSCNTLAVIGVNFLGIREDWEAINSVLSGHNTTVATIEDNAQWFPNLADKDPFYTDFVVFSFGKGKPLSLLGGGVLFSRTPIQEIEIKPVHVYQKKIHSWLLRIKYILFNQLLKPNLYWFLNHNPIFTPGKTRYKALPNIQVLDKTRKELLQTNYHTFTQQQYAPWEFYDTQLSQLGIKNRLMPENAIRLNRLLRYPFLCVDRTQRDALLTTLNQWGLGATAMYQRELSALDCPPPSMDASFSQNNAHIFADCLITLPCHPGVTPKHILQITHLLAGVPESDTNAV